MAKTSPFDFINSINFTKENLLLNTAEEKDYLPFIVNRGLSFSVDTVIYCNEMNSRPHIDNRLQYDFLRNVISKRKRYDKWIKAEKDADIDIIMEYFDCSLEKAKDAIRVLTDQDIANIKELLYKGGV